MVPIHASPSWLDLTLTASSTALTTHGGRRRKAHPGPSCGPAGEGDSEMGLRPGGSLPPRSPHQSPLHSRDQAEEQATLPGVSCPQP